MKLGSTVLPAYSMDEYDADIAKLYDSLSREVCVNFADRMQCMSREFVGKPYLGGALGEGPDGLFDQSPLYRTDAFDCVTYVSTVLALVCGWNLNSFKKALLDISYREGLPDYFARHHFMSVDWNVFNAKRGYIQDITSSILDRKGRPIFKIAEAYIDRPNWLRYRGDSDIKLLKSLSPKECAALLEILHAGVNTLKAQMAKTPYLPLDMLFSTEESIFSFFQQIPSGTIVEIVRPNWDLRDKIGTSLNISHLGFVFWLNGELVFRHASTEQKQVVEIPLKDYLSWCRDTIPTVKGINLQQVIVKDFKKPF